MKRQAKFDERIWIDYINGWEIDEVLPEFEFDTDLDGSLGGQSIHRLHLDEDSFL